MATKKIKTTKAESKGAPTKDQEIMKVRQDLAAIRLDIKAGVEKNTNAHKALKKKLAQLLTTNYNK